MLIDLTPYSDPFGLILPKKGSKSSGNGILYLSELVVMLANSGRLTNEIRLRFVKALTQCQLVPGVFKRHPTHPDQQGFDDYIGLVAASYSAGTQFHKDVLKHGIDKPWSLGPLKLYFNYCNLAKEPVLHRSSWLGRSPSFIAHIKYACNVKPSPLQRVCWAFSVAFSALGNHKHTDAWILSWLLVSVAGNRSGMNRIASKIYYRRLKRFYPQGLRDLFQSAFRSDHPLAILAPRL